MTHRHKQSARSILERRRGYGLRERLLDHCTNGLGADINGTRQFDMPSVLSLSFQHRLRVAKLISVTKLQAHVILVHEVPANHCFVNSRLAFEYNAAVHGSTAGTGVHVRNNGIDCAGDFLGGCQYKCHPEILAEAKRVEFDRL